MRPRTALAPVVLAAACLLAWPASRLGADPTGSVRGIVKVARPPAPPAPLPVTIRQEHCGTTVPSDELVVGPGGVLANAVVWIEGPAAPPPGRLAPVELALDQRGCRFTPHVATATTGATLALSSHDSFLHNVHAVLGGRSLFNVAIPVAGLVIRKPLRAAGHVTIGCDVHPWMAAHVHVFAHPWHAVTGADGSFQLPHVPPGTWALKLWHERLGDRSARVTVAGGVATANVTY